MASNGGSLRLEYLPLASLKPASRNPKQHAVKALEASLTRFGYVAPLILDDATGRLLAGHGRVAALTAAKTAGESAPERVQVRDGDWWVPVVRGVALSEREAEAYLLADNQLTLAGGWDQATLDAMLRDLNAAEALTGTGFTAVELTRALRGTRAVPPAQVDRAAELQQKWETAIGQRWAIGGHRLLCGDATNADDVERLLGSARPELTVTDPPYGVDYDPAWRDEAAAAGYIAYAARRVGRVGNDERVDWTPAFALCRGPVLYCWHAGRHANTVQACLEAAGFEVRAQLIWAKPTFAISRGHYHWRHEPCWYTVRKGASALWCGDHSQTTLWEIPLDVNVAGGHSTQKPVECMARAIRNHAGEVYDPFAGTGSTLVAAELERRSGWALEIDPGYVAVILERLAAMGLAPERAD